VARDGVGIVSVGSDTDPLDKAFVAQVEQLLAAR